MTNDFTFPSANEFQDLSFLGNLSDDIFDSSFTFLNNDTPSTMENSNHSSPSDMMPPPQPIDIKIEKGAIPNLAPFSFTAPVTDPSVALNAQGQINYPTVPSNPDPYPLPMIYDASVSSLPGAQSNYFHPYHTNVAAYQGRTYSPPKSPALSSSPHGSLASNRLSFGAPTALSPNLVSPHSILSSQLSDVSPSHSYGFPLPATFSGTPLTSIAPLANLSPSGLPHPALQYTTSVVPSSGPIRHKSNARPKTARNSTGGLTQEDDEDDLSEDEDEDLMAEGMLGLTSGKGKRSKPFTDAEKARKRVVGEKMRRDRLRDAFNRVQAALPSGPIEGRDKSKNAILDRTVTHIHRVQSENQYLRGELDDLKGKYAKLQAVLEEGFLAGAIARPSSNSPPGPSRR